MKYSIAKLVTDPQGRFRAIVYLNEKFVSFLLGNEDDCMYAGFFAGDNVFVKFEPQNQFAYFVNTNRIQNIEVSV